MATDSSDKKKPAAATAVTKQVWRYDSEGNRLPDGPPEPVATHAIPLDEAYGDMKPEPKDDTDYPVPGLRAGGGVKSWQRAMHQHQRMSSARAPAAKPKPSW